MGVHDGHRQRLRARFIEHGLASFNDINSLELLLSFAIPRKDTNELAHRLLDTFGSLENVFDASHQELTAVDGIGENAAVLLSLVPQIYKKAAVSKANEIKKCNDVASLVSFLKPRFIDEKNEVLIMVCLDSSLNVISCIEVARGTVNTIETNNRRIVELALKSRATSVALAHNHPNGVAVPSTEDDYFTKQVSNGLSSIGIKLVDHIIFAGDKYISYASFSALH